MFEMIIKMNSNKKVAFSYLCLGSVLITFSVLISLSSIKYVTEGENTIGEVVDLVVDDGSVKPIVSFTDTNGQIRKFESNVKCKPTCYEIGQQVKVIYIHSLDDVIVNDFYSLWFPSSLLFLIGFSFSLISIYQIRKLNRK